MDPLSASTNVCLATQFAPWFGVQLHVQPNHLSEALKSPDALQVAMQLGRLDFVSALVASLGTLIAVSAIFGFWSIRGAATRAARDAAGAEIRLLLPNLLTGSCLETLKKNPDLIAAAIRHDPSILLSLVPDAKSTLFGDIDAQEAENIAAAMGK
jgi:hypothetical protein